MQWLDIKTKKEGKYISYYMIDIFTFNIGKADNKNWDGEEVNYQVLEQIKDERFVAAKFSSKEIKICKPNIVIVFANCTPDVKKLAMDRWKIFKIIGEDLVDVTPKPK